MISTYIENVILYHDMKYKRPIFTMNASTNTPSPARIHLTNVPFTLAISHNAWGQPSSAQPVLISCTLDFRTAFASHDELGLDTVSYGDLSRGIGGAVETWRESKRQSKRQKETSVAALLAHIMTVLCAEDTVSNRALVDTRYVERVSLEAVLPRASLVGEAVVLTLCASIARPLESPRLQRSIQWKKLCVPTLVGLHAHERLRRQKLLTTVTLVEEETLIETEAEAGSEDASTHNDDDDDGYAEMEDLITRVCPSILCLVHYMLIHARRLKNLVSRHSKLWRLTCRNEYTSLPCWRDEIRFPGQVSAAFTSVSTSRTVYRAPRRLR